MTFLGWQRETEDILCQRGRSSSSGLRQKLSTRNSFDIHANYRAKRIRFTGHLSRNPSPKMIRFGNTMMKGLMLRMASHMQSASIATMLLFILA